MQFIRENNKKKQKKNSRTSSSTSTISISRVIYLYPIFLNSNTITIQTPNHPPLFCIDLYAASHKELLYFNIRKEIMGNGHRNECIHNTYIIITCLTLNIYIYSLQFTLDIYWSKYTYI